MILVALSVSEHALHAKGGIMFVGHYGVAFAVQSIRGAPSLATSFVAVQLVDYIAFTLALFDIEKWRPNPSIAGFMPMDLYYMPFTHSLLGCTVWAILAGILVAKTTSVPGWRGRAGVLTGGLVLSHWFLDLLVHRHDLGILGDDAHKFGFALWDHPEIAVPLELGILVIGFVIYQSRTTATSAWGKRLPWIVMAMLLVFQYANWYGPPPVERVATSIAVLLAYTVCVGAAWLLDRTRKRRSTA